MIVKVQRSINPVGTVLIYDKERSVFYQGPWNSALDDEMKPGELKAFFAAHVTEDQQISLNKRVPNQNW